MLALVLAGCANAATVTLMERQGGGIGQGTAASNFTGTGGDLTITLNGKTFAGRWVGERNMGFGVVTASAGSTSLLATSAVSGGGPSIGSALLRAPDGDTLHCEFRYSEWSATGQGVCQDRAGKLYDFQAE
jgi:hypothetical protein